MKSGSEMITTSVVLYVGPFAARFVERVNRRNKKDVPVSKQLTNLCACEEASGIP